MSEIEKEIVRILTSNNDKLEISIRVLLKFLTEEQQKDFLKNIK